MSTKTKLSKAGSWLVNTSIDDARTTVRSLQPTAENVATLQAAIEYEEANQKRSSMLGLLKAALKRCTPKAEVAVVVKPEQVLNAAKAGAEKHRDVIIKLEEGFAAASLPSRCMIGLHCLKAYTLFCVAPDKRKGVGGRGKKNSVTRDGVSLPEGGFEGWLAENMEWLKKPTAYKYMTAVKGLGLDETATEKQVAAALKKLEKPSLKSLCDAAAEPVKIANQEDPGLQQTEFDFLRDRLAEFRRQADDLLASLEVLKKTPDLHRVASARAYHILHDLTGSHWAPSDDPHEYDSVDPDSIEL